MNHRFLYLVPITAASLISQPALAFRILTGICTLSPTFTHQSITLAGLTSFPLTSCPASNIADYAGGVDFGENRGDWIVPDCPYLYGGKPNQFYRASHHFDRKPNHGQNHLAAFLEGTEHFQFAKQSAENAFVRGDTAAGMQFLGIALHAIQDLIAHSNLVDELSPQQQDQAINAVLTGSGNMPANLRLMYYDPAVPNAGSSVDIYTHADNAKDDPGLVATDQKSRLHILAGLKAVEASRLVIGDIVKRFGTSLCSDPQGKLITLGGSVDPNDKVGSLGVLSSRYLAAEEPLRYFVSFENIPTATLSAQEVVITDQLDLATMELSTFSLGPITLAGKIVTPPSGLREFSSRFDLRPSKNVIVEIDARLEAATGLATWRFSSIDPATGKPPLDPTVGFLPPNTNPPEGEGSVLFVVMPKQSLPTGAQIENRASIIFDVNTPIVTPEWLNTVDASDPTSRVLTLPASQPAKTFPVRWQGSDMGAGIGSYDLYVSDNGGPFDLWLTHTTAPQATFTGAPGHTYRFYSIARDLVGNTENAKAAAEATTTVSVALPTIRCTGCYFVINNLRAILAFNAASQGSTSTFSYNYRSATQTVQFASTTTSQILVAGNTATFSGQGTLNGQAGYTFSVTATDGGAVGSALDTVSINISGPTNYSYVASGTILGGDIVVKQ